LCQVHPPSGWSDCPQPLPTLDAPPVDVFYCVVVNIVMDDTI
jgi:hypothetical protein